MAEYRSWRTLVSGVTPLSYAYTMKMGLGQWPGAYQTSDIFVSAQFMTAICTTADQTLATSWAANMVRGGTFM